MEFFWNLIASFEFSCSYPYGNNHKELYEALSQSHEKPIIIQHVSCIYYQSFGQELMRNFMNLIPKLSFLTRCKIGGISSQWMMVSFHQSMNLCSKFFYNIMSVYVTNVCHKHQHDNLLLLCANVPHKVFSFFWGNPSIQILLHQWLLTTICLEMSSTYLWWREHHWDQNNIHEVLKESENLHLLHKFEQMVEKLMIQCNQSWASYLHKLNKLWRWLYQK